MKTSTLLQNIYIYLPVVNKNGQAHCSIRQNKINAEHMCFSATSWKIITCIYLYRYNSHSYTNEALLMSHIYDFVDESIIKNSRQLCQLPFNSIKLKISTDSAIMRDCPVSNPFTPDKMLMALVQNTASIPM